MDTSEFLNLLWSFYDKNARQLPWREPGSDGFSLYDIAVSELMLQQTQVDRVIPKYQAFLMRFPTIDTLALATTADVLHLWSGLGYNRRALYLHAWAKEVVASHLPTTWEELRLFKGFGENTAKAVFVYTYNEPLVFIETNIRTVVINHFFHKQDKVADQEIQHVLNELLDKEQPREFYWALMDYGSYLKRQGKGRLAQAARHKKQAAFEGSRRQIRGKILRILQQKDWWYVGELEKVIADPRCMSCIAALETEGFIVRQDDKVFLRK